MPFVQAKCLECGGMLAVDADKKAAVCQFCGEAFIVQEAINNYNTYNTTNNNTTHQYGDGAVVNIYEDKSKDFVIEAGVLKEYHGESADIIIPDNVTEIGSKAFAGSGIVSISIPQSVVKVEFDAFSGCEKLSKVIYNGSFVEWNAIDFVINGACMRTSNPNLYAKNLYINGEHIDGSFIIPEGLEKISDSCFCGCVNLNSVIIPNTVKEIGDLAFQNCNNLNSIELPNSVKKIGRQAFSNCSKLLNITFYGLEFIGQRAFYNCSSLNGIEIPDSIWYIGSDIFDNCNLKWIKLPGNIFKSFLEIDGDYSKLNSLKIGLPQTIEHIKLTKNFSNHDTTVEFEGRRIGVLSLLHRVTKIEFDDHISCIGTMALENCENLKSVYLPKSLNEIECNAFRNCVSLKNVIIPNGVRSIGDGAFSGCKSLESISIPDSVTNMGNNVFIDCISLEDVQLSSNLENLGGYIFNGCTKLTKLSIPKKISNKIQFDACNKIKEGLVKQYSNGSIIGLFFGMNSFEEYWKNNNKCQHCGGDFSILKKCKICGMKKDY